jgi:Flp pilus assembly protein TadD
MGDTSGAGEDFRMAIELKADTDVPMNNLARLSPEPTESFVAK